MRLLADSRPRPFALKDKLHFPLQRRQAASAGGVEEGSLLHHPISLALVSFGSKFRFPLPPPLLPFILLAALESSKVHMIESTFPFLRRALPILWSVGIKDDSHRLPRLALAAAAPYSSASSAFLFVSNVGSQPRPCKLMNCCVDVMDEERHSLGSHGAIRKQRWRLIWIKIGFLGSPLYSSSRIFISLMPWKENKETREAIG